MSYQKMYYPKWDYKCGKCDDDCDDEYDYKDYGNKCCDKDYGHKCCDKDYSHKCHDKCDDYDYPAYDMDCCMPKMKCKTEKKCIKTFTCSYKLYKLCMYKVVKVCPRCNHEYDHGRHPMCPKCRQY